MTQHVLVIGGGQNVEHEISLEYRRRHHGRAALPRVRGQQHLHRPRRAVETREETARDKRCRLVSRGAAAP